MDDLDLVKRMDRMDRVKWMKMQEGKKIEEGELTINPPEE